MLRSKAISYDTKIVIVGMVRKGMKQVDIAEILRMDVILRFLI